MMKTPLKIIAPVAAMLAISTAMPASAGNNAASVNYTDLDLTTASGQETLKGRIRGAVSKICSVSGTVSLRERLDAKNCSATAAERAEKVASTVIARHNDGRRMAATLSPVIGGN